MSPEKKAPLSHADRLMADLRGKIAAISNEANRSTEDCQAFTRKEADYREWLTRHGDNAFVLHRANSTAKTAELHMSNCPVIGGGEVDDEDTKFTSTPKVGCPTKPAALAYARAKKWRVNEKCKQCVAAPAE